MRLCFALCFALCALCAHADLQTVLTRIQEQLDQSIPQPVRDEALNVRTMACVTGGSNGDRDSCLNDIQSYSNYLYQAFVYNWAHKEVRALILEAIEKAKDSTDKLEIKQSSRPLEIKPLNV